MEPDGPPPPPPMDGYPPPPSSGGPSSSSSSGGQLVEASSSSSTSSTALVESTGVLPNLEPALANIEPIPIKKTLMIVNNFIINTVDFCNKFCVLSERKLAKISQNIQRIEIVLNLLEAKLESVPWLNGQTVGGTSAPPTSTTTSAPDASGAPPPPMDGAPPPPPGAPQPGSDAPPPPTSTSTVKLKDDLRYKKWIQMVAMGVLKENLYSRVQAEGLDPAVLDMDPEGPAPPGAISSQALVEVQQENDSDPDSD